MNDMKSRLSPGSFNTASALLLLSLCATACSNQQVYHAIQDSQRVDCQRYPDTRYEECIQQLDTPYEDYAEEREALGDG